MGERKIDKVRKLDETSMFQSFGTSRLQDFFLSILKITPFIKRRDGV